MFPARLQMPGSISEKKWCFTAGRNFSMGSEYWGEGGLQCRAMLCAGVERSYRACCIVGRPACSHHALKAHVSFFPAANQARIIRVEVQPGRNAGCCTVDQIRSTHRPWRRCCEDGRVLCEQVRCFAPGSRSFVGASAGQRKNGRTVIGGLVAPTHCNTLRAGYKSLATDPPFEQKASCLA